jgi:hypothetical protein
MMSKAKEKVWKEAVKHIDLLITHGGRKTCADGIGSAMIIRNATDCDVQFCDYGDKLHRNIPVRKGVILCDMSPYPGQEQMMADAGVLVLDHHESQQELVESMGHYGIFRQDLCGAELAYKYVWVPLMEDSSPASISQGVQAFAELCGIYDLWKRDSPLWEQACHLREALLFISWEMLKNDLPTLVNMHGELRMGRHICENKRTQVRLLASQVLIHEGELAIINNLELVNEIGDALRESDLKAVAGFGFELTDHPWEHLQLKVSLRAIQSRVDVARIAKSKGGGGHYNAAGFVIKAGAAMRDVISPVLEIVGAFYGTDNG